MALVIERKKLSPEARKKTRASESLEITSKIQFYVSHHMTAASQPPSPARRLAIKIPNPPQPLLTAASHPPPQPKGGVINIPFRVPKLRNMGPSRLSATLGKSGEIRDPRESENFQDFQSKLGFLA